MSDGCEGAVLGRIDPTVLQNARETDGLDTDLTILSSYRRRHSLYYLRENEIATVEELADALAGETIGDAATNVDERFEATKLALVHSVLPALRDAGVIEYDRRNGTVRYREPSESVRVLLELCSRLEAVSGPSE